MKIIIAQGNPESQYNGTRHNVGFFLLDTYAAKHDAQWQTKTKFKSEYTELMIKGEKILLFKPTTFYNSTGEAASAIKAFYKIENDQILVIHDELALPFGTLRTRQDGSDAGNNGIKSINAHIGTDYARLRVGIANDKRSLVGDADFVLGKFTADEEVALTDITKSAHGIINLFVTGTLTHHTVKALPEADVI
ncbi:MAG: aminoacyl-tRNA hydrolase [Candidatus Saccharimonadales bacterium]